MNRRLRGALIALQALASLGCSPSLQPPPAAPVPSRAPFLAPCPASPNCVSSEAVDAAHYVAPLRVPGDPAQAMDTLRRIIESMPRTHIVAASTTTLHAEFTSRFLRFVDDLDLQLDAAAHVVQIRSASRTGYSDLGVNRRRVEVIRDDFERSSSRQPG